MSVVGETEESDCVDADQDEPINKVARKHYNTSTSSDTVDPNNGGATISSLKDNKKISHTSELWNSLDTIIKGNGYATAARIYKGYLYFSSELAVYRY